MIYSLTTMHCSCYEHFEILTQTLDSLINNGIQKCLVSISFNDSRHYHMYITTISDLKDKYGDLVKIYIHFEYNCKFQHLQFIYNDLKETAKPDDTLLFCDEDTILITLPPIDKYKIISGFQYISNVIETDRYYNWQEALNNNKSSMKTDTNFSGYICPFNVFEMYFKLNTFDFTTSNELMKMSNQLIDVNFMEYLDKLDIYKPEKPFIFQRVWTRSNKDDPTWFNILKTGLYNIIEKRARIEILEKNYIKNKQIKQYTKYGFIFAIGLTCGYIISKLKR